MGGGVSGSPCAVHVTAIVRFHRMRRKADEPQGGPSASAGLGLALTAVLALLVGAAGASAALR